MPTYPTVTLQNVADDIASLIGTTWGEIDSEIQTQLVGFINDRQQEGLDEYEWPIYMDFEKRYFDYGLWQAGPYPSGAKVFYEPNSVYYENTSGGTTSGVPGTSSDWTETSDVNKIVAFTQPYVSGSTAVNEIFACYKDNPNTTEDQDPLRFSLFASDWTDGATSTNYQALNVHTSGVDHVWIQFAVDPTTHVRTNMATTIPKFLRAWIVRSAFADWNTENLQDSKAAYHLSEARKRLNQQYDKLIYRQGQAQVDNRQVQPKAYA